MAWLVRLVVIATLAWAGTAHSQAFGIREGTPISELTVIATRPNGFYTVAPPDPSNFFELYQVRAAPGIGVCRVAGIGVTLANDRQGDQARQRSRVLVEVLTARYGESVSYDFIRSGATWDGPMDWAMSIFQKERTYVTYFSSNIGHGIAGISVEANALDANDTYVNVSYEFSNYDRCVDYHNRVNTRGL